ncbi:MAG: hypothetical protein NXH95_11950 [Pseudomonadaceae bacterium]|nr:hypothetical protein [Pseudomonadaceae bacterium]
MIVSLAEAAELTGKSRQTIYRKAKKGELSVTTREDNSKGVDTSELERVFGTITVQEAGASEVSPGEAGIRQDIISSEEPMPDAAVVADLQRELATVTADLQLHQQRIDELKTDKLKLWNQLASQQQLLERSEQMATSLQSHKIQKLTRIANEGALFGLAGVCIGAVFFVLSSIL